MTQSLRITVTDAQSISALALIPPKARALYVFAHSAGAGMTHPSMTAIAEGLAARAIATLRYQFPYMENGSKRPDTPKIAHAAVRAACAEGQRLAPKLPLIAGGKSFGGRMTSQAQALEPLPGVKALAFIGFPLHPAGKPADERAAHLADVKIPMLFLQGTRDDLAHLDLLKPVVAKLPSAELILFDDADHSFHVPARTGKKDAQVREEMLDAFAAWTDRVLR